VWQKFTDVAEKHATSIFNFYLEDGGSKERKETKRKKYGCSQPDSIDCVLWMCLGEVPS
jgi:hypothetical protein